MFTKKELAVLKILVEREINGMTEDANKILISNSGFLTAETDDDLSFLKAEDLYTEFLHQLKKKL